MAQNRYYSSTAVSTTLTAGINNSATSITVASVSGFPGSFPYTLIIDRDTATEEVITVTAGAGTTLTVTRGSDSTAAVAHSNGAAVVHGVSARDYNEAGAHIGASSGVHGATGSVVGTSDAQTLTNKTLTAPAISAPAFSGTATGSLTNLALTTPAITGSGGLLTLPAGPDTLVGRATTDTLTNKTLNQPTVVGSGGTLTLPAGPDTLVGRATTDTLTNKTLNGATLNAASTIGGVSGTTLAADQGAWSTYSPTYTGFTKGNAADYWRYKQTGKTVHVKGWLRLGNTSAFTGNFRFSAPVGVEQNFYTQLTAGSANLNTGGFNGIAVGYDNSASGVANGAVFYDGASDKFGIQDHGNPGGTATPLSWATGVPFSWATNDEIYVSFVYEAA